MKVPAKILMVLVLLASAFYAFRVLSVHSAYVYWEDRGQAEQLKVGDDRTLMLAAYDEYYARRQAALNLANGDLEKEIRVAEAERVVLSATAQEAQLAAQNAAAAATSMRSLVQRQLQPLPSTYEELLSHLRETQSRRLSSLENITESNQDLAKELFNLYGEAGREREKLLRLEFSHFTLQDELRLRQDTLRRYRYLAPDLQRKIGDNGPLGVRGTVLGTSDLGFSLDIGQRHGVELYQKFGVFRGNRFICTLNVVALQNTTCQAQVYRFGDEGEGPQMGDVVRPLAY